MTFWDTRGGLSFLARIIFKVAPAVMSLILTPRYLKRIQGLRNSRITHILIIKAEGISPRVLAKLRSIFPDASLGLYLWDSVKNIPYVQKLAHYFDSVATFDRKDAERNSWHYRPLFSRYSREIRNRKSDVQYDWCFVGTIHSDRHKVISKLRSQSGPESRNFIHCYFQNRAVLLARFTMDHTLWFAPKGTLSLRTLEPDKIEEISKRSRAVLDIEHPGQTGLTMRTIESLLMGRKLITTNSALLGTNLHDASRVAMIDRATPFVPPSFYNSTFLPIDEATFEYYTCESWISEILQSQEKGHQGALANNN